MSTPSSLTLEGKLRRDAGIVGLSWLGGIGGGRGVIGFGWDILVVTIWSIVVLLLALRSSLDGSETAYMVARMNSTS
ncbi:hypothetical protein PWP93_37210 [Paraburkholderia sp. A1RI-2L]|uniref:hypothetical protein n=1 Tax=Paraburkholderia sp. A1RI-2L TaxID=3028367 RepID=UPI003B7901C1